MYHSNQEKANFFSLTFQLCFCTILLPTHLVSLYRSTTYEFFLHGDFSCNRLIVKGLGHQSFFMESKSFIIKKIIDQCHFLSGHIGEYLVKEIDKRDNDSMPEN